MISLREASAASCGARQTNRRRLIRPYFLRRGPGDPNRRYINAIKYHLKNNALNIVAAWLIAMRTFVDKLKYN